MVKKDVIELLEKKKEQFFDEYCDFDLSRYQINIEFWQKERTKDRVEEICALKGRDHLTLEEIAEQEDIGRGITLIYSDCAYVLITNVPYPTEKYFSFALYTELARIYTIKKALFDRAQIGLDEFEINSMMGYAFWHIFAPRMMAYELCGKEFAEAKKVCQRKTFLNETISYIDIDIKKKHLGCVLIADLYAICVVQDRLREKRTDADKYTFPIDKRWYVGKKLHKEMTELLKILLKQLNKEDPYSIDLDALEDIGGKVYDIFWKLKEYEATLAVV